MVTIVVGFNIGLALLCLGLACKVNRWRRSLRQAAYGLMVAERETDRVLGAAPQFILRGRTGTEQFRRYTRANRPQPHLETLWATLGLLRTLQRQHQRWNMWGCLRQQNPST